MWRLILLRIVYEMVMETITGSSYRAAEYLFGMSRFYMRQFRAVNEAGEVATVHSTHTLGPILLMIHPKVTFDRFFPYWLMNGSQ